MRERQAPMMMMRRLPLLAALTLTTSFFAVGCLSAFDTDSVDIQTPNPDPNPDPNPSPDPDPNPDPDPDPNPCEDEGACTPDASNTVGVCNEGACVPTGCNAPFLDCNEDLEGDGCESDSTSLETCGSCDNACEGGNAVWACTDNNCEVVQCLDGFVDVDGGDNGCETPIPDTLDPTDAEVVAHAVRLSWETEDEDILQFLVSWTQPVSGEVAERRITPEKRTEVVGPIDGVGEVTFFIQVVNNAGVLGEPGDGLKVEFTPRGWFNLSPGAFAIDAEFSGDNDEALMIGFGYAAHPTPDGRGIIPGKLPVSVPTIGFDVLYGDSPLRGLSVTAGFLAEVHISTNGGLTWEQRNPPLEDGIEPSDIIFQTARILNTGRIFIGGDENRVFFSDDFGEDWSRLETEVARENWFGMSYAQDEGGTRLFIVGDSAGSTENTVVLFSDDEGDNFETFDLVVQDDRGQMVSPTGIFAVEMLDRERGFIGARNMMLRTNDHWATAEIVDVPRLVVVGGDTTDFVRIRFDDTGRFGIATTDDGRAWSTTDGGGSWEPEPSLTLDTSSDEVWSVVSPITGAPNQPFVLMSTGGKRKIWQGEGDNRSFTDLSAGFQDDLIGVVANDDLRRIRAVSRQGVVLSGTRTPDTLTPFRNLALGPDDPEPGINAMDSAQNGDFLVVVGQNFLSQFSDDGGDTWSLISTSFQRGEHLQGVALNGIGSRGLIYGQGERGPLLFEFTNTPARLTPIPLEELDSDQVLQGFELTAVAFHPNTGVYAVAAQRSSTARLFIGSGPPNRRVWVDNSLRTSAFRSIAIPEGEQAIWAAGDSGTLFKFENGNSRPITPTLPPGVDLNTLNFVKIAFPNDADHGWLLTEQGLIFATTDGGDTWVSDRASDFSTRLSDIHIEPDNLTGVIVGEGGLGLWTLNGGKP